MSVYDFAVWYLWAVPLLTVAGIVALIVYMSLKWPSLPKPLRGFELVKPLLERLLKQGLQSGTLTIRHKKSSKAIEFRKYIRAKNNYGVALSFPGPQIALRGRWYPASHRTGRRRQRGQGLVGRLRTRPGQGPEPCHEDLDQDLSLNGPGTVRRQASRLRRVVRSCRQPEPRSDHLHPDV